MKKFIEKNYKLLIGIMLGFMLVVSVLNAKNDSAIFDETAHIGAAYSYVTQGEIRLNPEHPPLIKDLAGIPLAFMDLDFDTTKPFWTGELEKKWDEGQWAAGRHLLYENGNDADRIIFWSRIPIILISLLLGFFIFKWTRELAGTPAGIFALALYAFNPNILGHNHYVTTDIGIAAFTTFSFYYFLRFIKRPSWKNAVIGGIFLGLIQLVKFSSIVIFPIFGLILVIYPFIKITKETRGLKSISFTKLKILGEYLGKGLAALFISILMVWIVYSFNTFNMAKETVSEAINFNFPESQNENPKNLYTNKLLSAFNETSITRPLATYGIGMGYVFRRVAGGNGAYFLGQVSSKAFTAYFPVVFLIKEPLVSIFLVLAAIGAGIAAGVRKIRSFAKNYFKNITSSLIEYFRNNIDSASMFLFIVLYSYISITGNLNIGLRHLFPIFPLAYILTAKVIFEFIKRRQEKRSQSLLYLSVSILVLILVAQNLAAYPNYMSYFNEAVGGPKNGYKFVTDSNADWGQDLKRLKKFLDEHPEITKIRLDYFGGGDPAYYLGNRYAAWWDSKRPIEKGWYAISTNFLQGSIYSTEKTGDDSYRWLANERPIYQIGTSILVYHITNAK